MLVCVMDLCRLYLAFLYQGYQRKMQWSKHGPHLLVDPRFDIGVGPAVLCWDNALSERANVANYSCRIPLQVNRRVLSQVICSWKYADVVCLSKGG